MKYFLLLFSLFLFSCSKATIVSDTSIGRILDARVVETSFNESRKMEIWTENTYIIIDDLTSVPLRREAFIRRYSDRREFLFWEDSGYMYRIR